MSAEMQARRTAAAAVAADFEREANAFIDGDSLPAPDWQGHAWRLRTELRILLDQLERETPDQAAGQLAQIRLVLDQVLGDEYADRQYALEQIQEILRGDL